MPTGHTSIIKDNTTLEEFVMSCARAMMPLVRMRDEAHDAPIPEKFEVSDYYKNAVNTNKTALDMLLALKGSAVKSVYEAKYKEQVEWHKKEVAKRKALKKAYGKMLKKVNTWKPGKALEPLKKYMTDQLITSIEHDCDLTYLKKPERQDPKVWLEKSIETAKNDVAYSTKNYNEELTRTQFTNDWLKDLRASLKPTKTKKNGTGKK